MYFHEPCITTCFGKLFYYKIHLVIESFNVRVKSTHTADLSGEHLVGECQMSVVKTHHPVYVFCLISVAFTTNKIMFNKKHEQLSVKEIII